MIHIINRHCNFSTVSVNKKRPTWFSREKCFENLVSVFTGSTSKIHIIFDGDISKHFLWTKTIDRNNVYSIRADKETIAFKYAIDYALEVSRDKEDIIYFVEDDYLHRPTASDTLEEGFTILNENTPVCISLYDHNDKYDLRIYPEIQAQIFTTKCCHWRTTPSTTNTFAIKRWALEKYLDQFKLFSPDELPCSMDHKRHLQLWKLGVATITSIPGYSTHCEPDYLSPTINWEYI